MRIFRILTKTIRLRKVILPIVLVIFKTIRYLFLELFCAGPAINLTGSRLQLPWSTELGPVAETIPQNPTQARQSKGDTNEGSEIQCLRTQT